MIHVDILYTGYDKDAWCEHPFRPNVYNNYYASLFYTICFEINTYIRLPLS